jgi:hypothetical protein
MLPSSLFRFLGFRLKPLCVHRAAEPVADPEGRLDDGVAREVRPDRFESASSILCGQNNKTVLPACVLPGEKGGLQQGALAPFSPFTSNEEYFVPYFLGNNFCHRSSSRALTMDWSNTSGRLAMIRAHASAAIPPVDPV